MNSSLTWVLLFSLAGSVLSVLAAATYLLLPERIREKSPDYLISFAIGMLLGASFLHLLPEAIEQAMDSAHSLMGTALAAILVFFLLEKGLIWRHHHHHDGHAEGCEHIPGHAGTLILIGDSVHNFLDGVLVAAAFMHDASLGVVTALAIIAHEVPQELGDFAILIHSGYSRLRAFVFNLLTSLSMIVGAVLAWFALGEFHGAIPYLLTFTAASFVYIAVSDLMPTLNRRIGLRATVVQLVLIAVGVGCNVALHAH
ncbi:MAG: ZIP family metal transporter [Gammaproteobacteria bacterium]|nr:ZIP family metal transporter [Gammaproteobacteria bacterium]